MDDLLHAKEAHVNDPITINPVIGVGKDAYVGRPLIGGRPPASDSAQCGRLWAIMRDHDGEVWNGLREHILLNTKRLAHYRLSD